MTKKTKPKARKRLFLFGLLCIVVNGLIIYSLGTTWKQIYEKKSEKKDLSTSLVNLKENEETLKVEVNKLKDQEYVAKYAREKFLYSGKNEYIIKIK